MENFHIESRSLSYHHWRSHSIKLRSQVRARLHQASESALSQLYNDASNTILTENNEVTRKFVAIPFWSNSIVTISERSLGQSNVFTHMCHSVHGGRGLCMLSLPVWLTGPMFLLGRESLSLVPCSFQGGLCPGCGGVSCLGVSVGGKGSVLGGGPCQGDTPSRDTPYGNKQAVHILQNAFLFSMTAVSPTSSQSYRSVDSDDR